MTQRKHNDKDLDPIAEAKLQDALQAYQPPELPHDFLDNVMGSLHLSESENPTPHQRWQRWWQSLFIWEGGAVMAMAGAACAMVLVIGSDQLLTPKSMHAQTSTTNKTTSKQPPRITAMRAPIPNPNAQLTTLAMQSPCVGIHPSQRCAGQQGLAVLGQTSAVPRYEQMQGNESPQAVTDFMMQADFITPTQ